MTNSGDSVNQGSLKVLHDLENKLPWVGMFLEKPYLHVALYTVGTLRDVVKRPDHLFDHL